MKNRNVHIDGIINARDLGGLKTDNGKVTKTGNFFRTASLSDITESGMEDLRRLKIKDIVDLRSTFEVNSEPNPLAHNSDFVYHNVPILDHIHSSNGNDAPVKKMLTMEDLYEHILADHKGALLNVMEILAESESPSLYHCTVGKDRTGLTTMFLLSLVGVPRPSIVKDYAVSEGFLKPYFEKKDKNISKFAYISPPSAIKNTFSWLDENYNGPEGFLDSIGLSSSTKNSLKEKLV